MNSQSDHSNQSSPPNALQRTWRKIGGGSLAFSLLVHSGLVLVAGMVVFSRTSHQQVDFLPGGTTRQGADASAQIKATRLQKRQSAVSKRAAKHRIIADRPVEGPWLPEPVVCKTEIHTSDTSETFDIEGLGTFDFKDSTRPRTGRGPGTAAGWVPLPPDMRARCSARERLEKLRQTGGRPECEAAVSKSLEWLKTKQNPDGSWGRANKAAMTGLTLLCYLGRCETPDSPFYGDNVMKGILYLIELSKKNEWGFITEDFKGNAGAYEHGIATYALGEMYTLARLGSKSLPGMREAFEKGVELIIKCQNKDGRGAGSWDYYTKNVAENGQWGSGREDLSVAGWQYQALKAAKHTGLKINGLSGAIEKCLDYIERLQTKDGGIGNPSRDAHYNQWSLTGAGVLGLQTLGKGNKKTAISKGIKFLRDFITAEPLDWNRNCNLYCWYYYTQAFFQQGGEDWKFYNEQFLPQILANQNPDGSWKTGRANWEAGSTRGNEIYHQTLCTLQLEVYYRYLKVADREDDSFFDR
jgi:hypothetical protein